ncbi:hypothetical protein AAFF_G00058300 [Aldrovandia affinis]|uniref:Uncharacterized protein n=1 Tax=Aldrovandia affinis TaxID=143900 RepID=A0AAD7WDY9_9TELE|nr:hypothetical protein AAFF_G00058300 [Aldrovandia affinis]
MMYRVSASVSRAGLPENAAATPVRAARWNRSVPCENKICGALCRLRFASACSPALFRGFGGRDRRHTASPRGRRRPRHLRSHARRASRRLGHGRLSPSHIAYPRKSSLPLRGPDAYFDLFGGWVISAVATGARSVCSNHNHKKLAIS